MSRRDFRQMRRVSTGGASTNPKIILGAALLSWYRSDLGITLNGSTVSAWADQSGTGDANKNASQGTGANQPTYNTADANYNGHQSLTFAAGNLLPTGTWAVAMAQPLTIFVVGHQTSSVGTQYFYDSLSATQLGLLNTATPDVAAIANNTEIISAQSTLNTPSIITMIWNAGSSSIAVRQNTAQTTGNPGNNGATGLTIGNTAAGGHGLGGPLVELIVASGALSASLIANTTAYLAVRYGLSQGP